MARILASVPTLGTDMFYLVDHDNVQQIRTLITSVPMVLEVETFTNLTPIMYAMLKNKKKIVNIMAGRSPSRFRDSVLLGIYMGDVSAVSTIIRSGVFEKTHETALFYGNYLTPLMYACNCNHYEMDRVLDPVRRAFKLAKSLERCKNNDPINADLYEKMAQHAGQLAIAFLNCCETDDEVSLIFKQTDGLSSDVYADLPCIRLAVDTKQKEFLSDPICLKIIKKHWMGGWNDWSIVSKEIKTYRILYHTLLYPLTSVLYVLSNGDLGSSYDYPVARFVSFVTSYLMFLLCLLVFTQHQEARNLRGPPDTTIKTFLLYYIWSYIGGMCVVLWTDMNRRRWRNLFGAWWRWFDFVQMMTYGLAYWAFHLSEALMEFQDEPYVHRIHWDPRHPTLVFEILFTCAAIMSSWRIFYFLQLQRTLGPLVVTLMLILFSMLRAMKYLYWAWYGYLDPERLEEILGKHGERAGTMFHLSLHSLGELFCATYYVVLVVSLLNVMISMMASSAGTILKRRHLEWNYVRCQVWCEFSEDIRAVPPPICLLQLAVNMPTWFCRRLCGSYGKLSMWQFQAKLKHLRVHSSIETLLHLMLSYPIPLLT
ncbi:Short transient receptor potential channel 5 [Trichuris trichiura]|uniref:Short transient receptor potential channel 5 n=1 Tax=Trichuris trichiura TaxID=36087 RepID=A0A077Z6A2_TRITR|nr:Short transient receptor potential channel 5 [Trichuris trichiura]